MNIEIFYSNTKGDYELLDTGGGERLERFGQYSFVRPYEEAVWKKTLKKEWSEANGKFIPAKTGEKAGWRINKNVDKIWVMSHRDIKFNVSPTPFRHFGFFPEQASHWDFIEEKIRARVSSNFELPEGPAPVLRGRAQGRKMGRSFLDLRIMTSRHIIRSQRKCFL